MKVLAVSVIAFISTVAAASKWGIDMCDCLINDLEDFPKCFNSNCSECNFRLGIGMCLSCDNATSHVYSGVCFMDLEADSYDMKANEYKFSVSATCERNYVDD